jgi:hypothetical protein
MYAFNVTGNFDRLIDIGPRIHEAAQLNYALESLNIDLGG